ncbi:Uma2 family endonuclease, partial [Methylogaea oryzae]|uniref:Uma2 family endonuclease n=1 Tax=Methylogaea oryzae TaxID=1295382 RepID=UPI003570E39B
MPDLAGWRRERLPALPDTSYFDLAPDWVCEVLSPSTARMDRADKLPIYAAHGVGHAWLIDPDAQTLEVFALVDGRWRLECVHQKDDEVRAPPFEALGFGLGRCGGEPLVRHGDGCLSTAPRSLFSPNPAVCWPSRRRGPVGGPGCWIYTA